MAKPAILTVDDDPAVSYAISRDLGRRYGPQHQVVRASSGAHALDILPVYLVHRYLAAI